MDTPRKFDITKELNLGFLGEEWKECSMKFHALGLEELKTVITQAEKAKTDIQADIKNTAVAIDAMVDTLKAHFVSGTGIIEGKTEALVADDLHALPAEVVNKAFHLVSGNVDANLAKPSAT